MKKALELIEELKHLAGEHDQRKHGHAGNAIPEDIRNMTFYHSTSNQASGEAILESGKINPSNLEGRAGYLSPVAGMTYFSTNTETTAIYSLGGVLMGVDMPESKLGSSGRYGYVFEVSGRDFEYIQPDEDSIGEAVYKGNLPWLNDMAKYALTTRQMRKVKDGEYIYWAQAGKKLVKLMSDEQKYDLIRAGANVAARGEFSIRKAYRIDKTRSRDVASGGENLLAISQQVKSLLMVVKHLAGEHDQKSHGHSFALSGTSPTAKRHMLDQKASLKDFKSEVKDKFGLDVKFDIGVSKGSLNNNEAAIYIMDDLPEDDVKRVKDAARVFYGEAFDYDAQILWRAGKGREAFIVKGYVDNPDYTQLAQALKHLAGQHDQHSHAPHDVMNKWVTYGSQRLSKDELGLVEAAASSHISESDKVYRVSDKPFGRKEERWVNPWNTPEENAALAAEDLIVPYEVGDTVRFDGPQSFTRINLLEGSAGNIGVKYSDDNVVVLKPKRGKKLVGMDVDYSESGGLGTLVGAGAEAETIIPSSKTYKVKHVQEIEHPAASHGALTIYYLEQQ